MTEIVTASQYRALRIKAEKKPVKRKKNTEYDIQCAFMREMSAKYPGVLVFSDTAAHIGKKFDLFHFRKIIPVSSLAGWDCAGLVFLSNDAW